MRTSLLRGDALLRLSVKSDHLIDTEHNKAGYPS